jgi:hypothetical protein
MSRKRKEVTMIVTVSVARDRTAAEARAQVRDILRSELTWDENMKVRAVRTPGPAIRRDQELRRARLRELRAGPPPLLKAMGVEK